MKRHAPVLALAAGVTAITATAAPYSVLDAFRETVNGINSMPGLKYTKAMLLVQSKNPMVDPTTIVLTIHTRAGEKTLRVGPGGLLDVPKDSVAKAENPEVTLNQPKGTVNISAQPLVRAKVGNSFSLDVANEMAAEYQRVRDQSPLLAKTYRIAPKYLRVIGKGSAITDVETSCGVVFKTTAGGMRTPLSKFPKDCSVKVTGPVERIEFVFVQ